MAVLKAQDDTHCQSKSLDSPTGVCNQTPQALRGDVAEIMTGSNDSEERKDTTDDRLE